MPTVYDLPPLGYLARAQSLENPRNVSEGISGARRVSQTRPSRRKFALSFHGIGSDLAGGAYIEELRRKLDGQAPLVRVEVCPDAWHIGMSQVVKARNHGWTTWRYSGEVLTWNYQAHPMRWWWSGLQGTYGSDYGGHFMDVTGLQANSVVAMPGERVTQSAAVGRVMGVTKSDVSGNARIYTDVPFTTGLFYISSKEWTVAFIDSLDPVQIPAQGGYDVQFLATEALADDYTDGFSYVNPWRAPA